MLPKTILVTNASNIFYFSGFTGGSGYLALQGKKGFLFTDARYHLLAKTTLKRSFKIIDTTDGFEIAWKSFLKKHRIRKIGVSGKHVNYAFWREIKRMSAKTRVIDINDALDEKRMCKNDLELSSIKASQQITDKIFIEIKSRLKKGMTEKEIAWQIKSLAHDLGADDVSFPPIVAIAENSASPHHEPTDKKLVNGDMILIDMGVKFKGYCSDMTRVIFTKKPTPEQTKIYNLVLNAQESVIKKLRAGMTGKTADKIARGIIKKAGFEKQFGHALGHGVGLDIHEPPNLSKKYNKKIPEKTVVTVEPGVYLPQRFGIRIEDMVIVGKKRVINLTKSPKSIQKAIIQLK